MSKKSGILNWIKKEFLWTCPYTERNTDICGCPGCKELRKVDRYLMPGPNNAWWNNKKRK